MSLSERLSSCKTDQERDQLLAQTWSVYRGTEQEEALMDLLHRLHQPAYSILISSNSDSARRHYAAGIIYAIESIIGAIKASIYVNPEILSDNSTPLQNSPQDAFFSQEDLVY